MGQGLSLPVLEPQSALLNGISSFPYGIAVELQGLSTERYNGQAGFISGHDNDKGRFQVRLSDGKAFWCKPANLRHLNESSADFAKACEVFHVGTGVELTGLAAENFNGSNGIVVAHALGKERFKIKLISQTSYLYKVTNLKRLDTDTTLFTTSRLEFPVGLLLRSAAWSKELSSTDSMAP